VYRIRELKKAAKAHKGCTVIEEEVYKWYRARECRLDESDLG
jgi:hypothetical protein